MTAEQLEELAGNIPNGAIHNFIAHYERVKSIYGFECDAGPIENCYDFIELYRCYNAMADFIDTLTAYREASK